RRVPEDHAYPRLASQLGDPEVGLAAPGTLVVREQDDELCGRRTVIDPRPFDQLGPDGPDLLLHRRALPSFRDPVAHRPAGPKHKAGDEQHHEYVDRQIEIVHPLSAGHLSHSLPGTLA